MYVCVSGYAHVSASTSSGQRHHLPLEVESQSFVSHLTGVLGTELWSPGRAACAFVLSHLSSPSCCSK